MIRSDKQKQALEAINIVLSYARMMAASHAAYDDLVAVLDVAEYLPTLFLRTDDMTDHFRDTLKDHAARYSAFQAGLEKFDRIGM
jgi:hypothetical protein